MLLVTGITGHSGKYFLQELINNKTKVEKITEKIRVSVRQNSNTELLDNCNLPVEKCVGDITDEEFLNKIMQGVDTLLHIAGIRYSRKIVSAAIANHVKRIILVHTTGVYSKYKAASREYKQIDSEIYETAKKNNIALTILRPTMIYGSVNDRNVIKFIKLVDKFKIVPVVNHAKYELQPVHAKDLGRAYYDVLMNPQSTSNKDYNLSGKSPIMLIDMLKEIAMNLGVRRKYFNVPFPIAYAGAWLIYLITFTKKDFREKVQRLCESRIFSHEDASKDFGYAPVSFEDGIREEVADYLKLK
jgi:nucleoside-diphosphate-sugar epimerase